MGLGGLMGDGGMELRGRSRKGKVGADTLVLIPQFTEARDKVQH